MNLKLILKSFSEKCVKRSEKQSENYMQIYFSHH